MIEIRLRSSGSRKKPVFLDSKDSVMRNPIYTRMPGNSNFQPIHDFIQALNQIDYISIPTLPVYRGVHRVQYPYLQVKFSKLSPENKVYLSADEYIWWLFDGYYAQKILDHLIDTNHGYTICYYLEKHNIINFNCHEDTKTFEAKLPISNVELSYLEGIKYLFSSFIDNENIFDGIYHDASLVELHEKRFIGGN